jgi:hypothetical protein
MTCPERNYLQPLIIRLIPILPRKEKIALASTCHELWTEMLPWLKADKALQKWRIYTADVSLYHKFIDEQQRIIEKARLKIPETGLFIPSTSLINVRIPCNKTVLEAAFMITSTHVCLYCDSVNIKQLEGVVRSFIQMSLPGDCPHKLPMYIWRYALASTKQQRHICACLGFWVFNGNLPKNTMAYVPHKAAEIIKRYDEGKLSFDC